MTEDATIDRLNTHSAEVSTPYPHHRTHGLALPFGWTYGMPTELSHCHDTLSATPTNSPLGLVLGGPSLPKAKWPPSWQINGPKWGQGTITTTGSQGYVCLPGQGNARP